MIEAVKIAGPDTRKLYVKFSWFFIDISGLINSFGLGLFMVLEYVIVLLWIATGSSRKSICPRLNGIKVASTHTNIIDFMIR